MVLKHLVSNTELQYTWCLLSCACTIYCVVDMMCDKPTVKQIQAPITWFDLWHARPIKPV